MDLIQEHNKRYAFFKEITGEAMRVHRKYGSCLVESAYEAALKYLLELKGMKVERQVYLPLFWDNVPLDQSYRMDLIINGNIICELKAVQFVGMEHRRQLESYMNITHTEFGMLINFGSKKLYSEWYRRDPKTGWTEQVRLM
jgi:GxxExxY protein